jgi:hypothetical protein
MKKSWNAYLWPEKFDMSKELTENIISKLENRYINTDWSLSLFQSHHHKIPRCV